MIDSSSGPPDASQSDAAVNRPLDPAVLALFPPSLEGATQQQRELASRVRIEPFLRTARFVAGADVSYSTGSGRLFASVTLFDALSGEHVETGRFSGAVKVPYVPGFLSYREGPAVLRALARVRRRPDVLLCDGQGLAHPRRLGLACHLGVALDLPTVGVGKSRLVGRHREPGLRRGSRTRLVDRGEVVGAVVRTRDGVRPLYISPGHRVDLDSCVSLVLAWCRGFRLPEPVRLADREVARMRRTHAPDPRLIPG
jgi:deoxyribonuclease V